MQLLFRNFRFSIVFLGSLFLWLASITNLQAQEDECLSGDCQNGYGEMKCSCGYTYKGYFENGQKTQGIMIKKELTYTGTFEDDMAQGKGRIVFVDGSWYEGDFYASQPHGMGEYKLANGAWYKGEMQAGDFHGIGLKVQEPEGGQRLTWMGQFSDDQLNGWGAISTETFHYTGQLKDNLPHGVGVWIDRETGTQVKVGLFKQGKLKEEVSFSEEEKGYVITSGESKYHFLLDYVIEDGDYTEVVEAVEVSGYDDLTAENTLVFYTWLPNELLLAERISEKSVELNVPERKAEVTRSAP